VVAISEALGADAVLASAAATATAFVVTQRDNIVALGNVAVDAISGTLDSRGGNMEPDGAAHQGGHTTVVREGGSGKVKKYQEWVPNEPRDPRDKRRFKPGKRFDNSGPDHTNPNGTKVKTPHINEPDGTACPPRPDETPRA
jgi:hypothetical protein